MRFTIKLTKEDFLVHQLYTASNSEMIKKKRAMSRFVIPIIYLGAGVYFYFSDKLMISIVFSVIAVFWFFIYPFYSRRRYKRQFTKHVDENYKQRVNNENELIIDTDFIRVKDEKSESKISIQEVTKLVELIDHFLIQLKSGLSIIIPKREVTDEKYFRKKINSLGIDILDEKEWKWR